MYLTIVIPAYNEDNGIGEVLDEIMEVMGKSKVKHEIIVVDDGSSDKTSIIVKGKKGVRLISHEYNKGYGASLKTGIRHAKGEWILITDADGTYPNKDIPKLLRYTNQYDMVVGSRTGKDVKIPLPRRPAKWFLSKLANYLSGTRIPDLNSGFRVFKKDVAMRFFHLFPEGYSFTTTITLSCLSQDYKIKFVPIPYFKRKGKSSIHPIKDFIGFTTLILKITTYFNPMRSFSLLSALLISAGFFIFLHDILILNRIVRDVSIVILTVASIQIFLFGLLADLVIREKRG